jgi:hypothetical protein
MNPNCLVTFDAAVRLQVAVNARGDLAAYFAASFNVAQRLTRDPLITEEFASRGIAILDIQDTALVTVEPINESSTHD